MKKAKRYRKNSRMPHLRWSTILLRTSVAGIAILLCAAALLLMPAASQIENTKQVPQMSSDQSVPEVTAPSSAVQGTELEPSFVPDKPPERSQVPAPESASITILGVGDNLIHDGIYRQANRRTGGTSYDFSPVYEHVAPYVQKADIAVINQETPIAGKVLPLSGYPRFNSPPELGDELVQIGFDVITHANNHILDQGEQGVRATLDYWDTKDVAVVGAYRSDEDLENIRIVEKNGIKTAHIGVTEMTNGLFLPKNSPYHVLLTSETDLLKHLVEKAKSLADVVVVSVHWGEEYTHKPTKKQTELAQNLVDWGADIIFGNHAHTIQPLTVLTRISDGAQCPVVYALGNYVSAQDRAMCMVGGMLSVTVEKEFAGDQTTVTGIHFEPIVTHYGKNFSDITIYPLEQYTEALANQHGVREYDTQFSLSYIQQMVSQNIPEKYRSND